MGLFLIGSLERAQIGESEHSFFVAVADRLGAALMLATDRLDMGIRRKRFRALSTFAARLAATPDVEGLRSSLAGEAAAVVRADRALVCVPGDGPTHGRIVSAYGLSDRPVGTSFELDGAERKAIATSHARPLSTGSGQPPDALVTVVAIKRGDAVAGLLRLERSTAPLDHFELEAVRVMADSMAIALGPQGSGFVASSPLAAESMVAMP